MSIPRNLRRVLAALATVGMALALVTPAASARESWHPGWVGAWSGSVQQASAPPWGEAGWSAEGFDNHSVRQVVRVSTGGPTLRVRLSNEYGTEPLRLTGATVARAGEGAAVRPGTLRPLTFRGSKSTVIRPGGLLASDPVLLPTAALDELSVTLYFAGKTGPSTQHNLATELSYRAEGDHRFDRSGRVFDETSESWYYLSGVDVVGWLPWHRGSVATFGDSITDGFGSTPGANNRYPNELAERLVAAGKPLGVLNAGISGNRVLSDSPCFGEEGIARFERDVLDQPGVRTVIVLEGINDIGFGSLDMPGECGLPTREVTAEELIAGHRKLIRAAKAEGLTVIGATLLPYKGAGYYTPEGEDIRDTVNEWIRTSGAYDTVVDLDRALADPNDPDRLNPAYDSGDALHPNDAGMHAMAAAVDLNTL
ncbi:SGNH/GDSL hydrolase family protein [Amycolatopsis cihanbeyliensis]|uniref:SGNH/GDSL hydrolase family protein n=1 Tax=Amycolatopsis cihanbeyliensis TaxID=1128664 RepID=UPI001153023D|nr:SGNH/GDSL hydrolase family protein [Amycolatopsis cihanbeyliensis]